ncbi:hypothetical protein ACIP2X_08295 [Streptomyces sp. NPDC089424]|uniref:hypothetical protein n=1 Tax=Streptomyces sp. NPDC089424 TaxID=3365917 RepID=UPI00381DE5EA
MTSPHRFHLLLTVGGRRVQHGWWGSEVTARDTFRRWVGKYGSMPGARLTLTGEDTDHVLVTWPYNG